MAHPPDAPGGAWSGEPLEAYLDGELSEVETARLERELADSAELRRELEVAREVRAALRGLPEFDASPLALGRIRRQAETVRRRRARRWVGAAAVAATLAAVGLGVVLSRGLGREPSPGPAEVARAAEEARWVLARVDRLTRKAGVTVRQDVMEKYLMAPTRRGLAASLLSSPSTAPKPSSSGEEQDDEV